MNHRVVARHASLHNAARDRSDVHVAAHTAPPKEASNMNKISTDPSNSPLSAEALDSVRGGAAEPKKVDQAAIDALVKAINQYRSLSPAERAKQDRLAEAWRRADPSFNDFPSFRSH
jgi:hypothetical protein